jgi:hypothetical protein
LSGLFWLLFVTTKSNEERKDEASYPRQLQRTKQEYSIHGWSAGPGPLFFPGAPAWAPIPAPPDTGVKMRQKPFEIIVNFAQPPKKMAHLQNS